MFVVCLLLSIMFLLGAILYYSNEYDFKPLHVIFLLASLSFTVAAVATGVEFGRDAGKAAGRVQGLVESGKYIIVTNEDYSLKELETFMKVNGCYLKENSTK